MGLFEDLLSTANHCALSNEQEQATSIDIAMLALGTLIPLLKYYSISSEPNLKKIASDTWEGFSLDASCLNRGIPSPIPLKETTELFYHLWGIGQILSNYACGQLGTRPEHNEILDLIEIHEYGCKGGVLAQKWALKEGDSIERARPQSFDDYLIQESFGEENEVYIPQLPVRAVG